MKKVLLVLGGICPQPYAYDDVVKSSFNHLGYDEIIEIDYEPFLDKRYKWIPFYDKMRILDKHGDWWQFALHPEVRESIRTHVSDLIKKQLADAVIDIVAHSLGTWVILGCDVIVNKVMLFGSPIGSRSLIVRKNVEKELDKSFKLQASVIHYCYNKYDFVSTHKPIESFINRCKNMLIYACSKGHDLKKYLDSYCEVFI